MARRRNDVLDSESGGLESTTVWINRTSTTVKGGRRLGFAALVVVGDRSGSVGVGYGKGRGVPVAIEKAQKDAKKNLFKVRLNEGTLTHPVVGRYCASKVRLIPAAPGTGVIAGGTVRAVLEMVGVQDCLTKAYGSTSKANLCKAVVDGLQQLRQRNEIAELRGVEIKQSTVDETLETSRKTMEALAAAAPKIAPKAKAAANGAEKGADGGAATAVAEPPAEEKSEPAEQVETAVEETPAEPATEVKAPEVAAETEATPDATPDANTDGSDATDATDATAPAGSSESTDQQTKE